MNNQMSVLVMQKNGNIRNFLYLKIINLKFVRKFNIKKTTVWTNIL